AVCVEGIRLGATVSPQLFPLGAMYQILGVEPYGDWPFLLSQVFVPAALLLFVALCRVAALDLPLRAGLSRSLRRTVPYALTLLAVLYLAVLVPTTATDRALESHVEHTLTDELAYLEATR